ncbi:ABC transporter substrate-binding protein [Microbacterium paludicola]|uniref:ABC transporter substrate-binding protein n=1 Tax=Microbacterium paludicola TaxID=300019 RepID=A0A4Y9FWX0_9MICO|nr:ABC transporter substrate-binding protein [Microbacterium paludicola]MBF0816589.1 ABC transporter substrate-binding protein [Microbacterium paludicola]TFU32776.1 ABC transporter substrate-binding protein [Microbacterium paludicola]
MHTPLRTAAVAVFAAAVLALAGCTSAGTEAGTATPSVVTIAFQDGGVSIDPSQALGLTADSLVLATYDTLVKYHAEDGQMVAGEYDPSIAESWTTSEDGLTWTFSLRDDVTFQSGNPLTAADVKFSLDRGIGTTFWELGKIEDVVVIDDYTVDVNLTEANPGLLDYIGMYSMSILDQETVEAVGDVTAQDTWLDTNTAGTGPYILDSWDPATEAKLHANPDYFGEGPAIENVTIRFVPEMATQIQQLEQDDVQLIYNIPFQNIEDLASSDTVSVIEVPAGNTNWMTMNNTTEPFTDVRVRQALAYATPYDDIVESALLGHGVRDKSPLSPITPGYDGDVYPYDYDLDKAQELLEEAGYADGFEFTTLVANSNTLGSTAATLMQESFAEVGVTMNISTVTSQQLSEQRMDAESIFGSWLSFINLPRYHLGFLIHSEGSANYAHYSNPQVDALMDEAQYLEGDEAQAKWTQLQALVAEDAPWINLFTENATVGVNRSLEGYTGYVDQLLRIADLHYAE